eukprot:TRINITY_DN2244_c0_g1_i1.p1 TRINITY_DN2244_c0_g1~~TRINITY_DN2244_c0_g1_i1.p1  ORF type:complete len:265 (-),score=56.11 TRINITY_DN2244_c0_g1_i1:77-871(-)
MLMKLLFCLSVLAWSAVAQSTIAFMGAPVSIVAGTTTQTLTVNVTNAQKPPQTITVAVQDVNLVNMGMVQLALTPPGPKPATLYSLTLNFNALTVGDTFNWIAVLADSAEEGDPLAAGNNNAVANQQFTVAAAPTVMPPTTPVATVPATMPVATMPIAPTAPVMPTTTVVGGGTTNGGTTQQNQTGISSGLANPATKGGIIGGVVAVVLVGVAAVIYRRRKAMVGETNAPLSGADRHEMLSRQLSFLQSERGSVPPAAKPTVGP